jgi:predicted aspartyl protease
MAWFGYNCLVTTQFRKSQRARAFYVARQSAIQILLVFKYTCLLVFIVTGVVGYALCQSKPISELKTLYECHQWFALRDAVKTAPQSTFYRGAVDAAFNDLPSAQKHLEAVITSSPHSPDAYEAYQLLATLYFRNGLYREALSQVDSMIAEKPSAEDTRNMRPLFEGFGSQGDQTLVKRDISSVTMQHGTEGLYLPLTINGKESAYAFDTGANFSVMSESEASRLSLHVHQVGTRIGDSSGGQIGLRVAIVENFVVGGLHLKNVAFAVLPDSQEPFKDLPDGKRGLIGIPVLLAMQAFQWEPAGKFILGLTTKNRDLDSSNLCFDESFPVTQAWFQDKPMELTVDSGAQTTVLGPPFAKDFASLLKSSGHAETHKLTGVAGSSSYDSVLLSSVTIKIGGHDVTLSPAHVLTNSSSDTSSWAAGNLGIDLLNQAHIISFDFNAMTMNLQ